MEGGFNQETVTHLSEEKKKEFSAIAMSKLNTLIKKTSFENIEPSLTTVRTHSQFSSFRGDFTIISMFVDLVANESWRSRLSPEAVTACKELFLKPRYFKCFNADNLKKIDTHLTDFVKQLEAFTIQEDNNAITALFAIPIAQTNRFLYLFNHLKKVDLTKAEAISQKHFSTLDPATFIKIGTEIQKALLVEDAYVKECITLVSPLSLSSLSVTLEDAEILMRLITATKARNNFITYAGLAHSLNINKALESEGFKQVKHDGPTILEPSKVRSYGLDEETIKSNSALFLGLLQHPST